MDLAAVFPTTEIGSDPIAIRDFAQAAEAIGYTHLIAYDHVIGAAPERAKDLVGPYTSEHAFHEPLVLFGYLAGLTERIQLTTGVVILPQRQTALVAKQAVEVDLLSGGRLVLGVGTGWNPVEYEVLNEDFSNRGRRQEEQIRVLRALWSEDLPQFEGEWHHIDRAGINPLPGRHIPIWLGGWADIVLRRAARVADGWMPRMGPGSHARDSIERLHGYLRAADRDPTGFVVQATARMDEGGPDEWAGHADAWRSTGATHLSVVTMDAGLRSPADHIDALRRYWDAVQP